jgi:hypothetical protein
VPGYKERFPVGDMVEVVGRECLEDFRRTWRWHNGLTENQLAYAGAKSCVATVSFYHGGDALYTLEGVPGLWHEVCLRSAQRVGGG